MTDPSTIVVYVQTLLWIVNAVCIVDWATHELERPECSMTQSFGVVTGAHTCMVQAVPKNDTHNFMSHKMNATPVVLCVE